MNTYATTAYLASLLLSFALSMSGAYYMTLIWRADRLGQGTTTEGKDRLGYLRCFMVCVSVAPALSAFAFGGSIFMSEHAFAFIAGGLSAMQIVATAYAAITVIEPLARQPAAADPKVQKLAAV